MGITATLEVSPPRSMRRAPLSLARVHRALLSLLQNPQNTLPAERGSKAHSRRKGPPLPHPPSPWQLPQFSIISPARPATGRPPPRPPRRSRRRGHDARRTPRGRSGRDQKKKKYIEGWKTREKRGARAARAARTALAAPLTRTARTTSLGPIELRAQRLAERRLREGARQTAFELRSRTAVELRSCMTVVRRAPTPLGISSPSGVFVFCLPPRPRVCALSAALLALCVPLVLLIRPAGGARGLRTAPSHGKDN